MSHAIQVALVAVFVLSSGCTSTERESPDPSSSTRATDTTATNEGRYEVHEPNLTVGTTWHYRTSFFYDIATTLNVTVAKANATEYLFASPSKADLVGEALWGDLWYGRQAHNLTPIGLTTQWIAFPLYDGRTWEFSPGRPASQDDEGRPARFATATQTIVATPNGSEAGFAIDVTVEGYTFHGEYAPSVGYFTLYDSSWNEGERDRLELVSVSKGKDAVWFETGTATMWSRPNEHKMVDVPAGFDSVLLSAGSSDGNRVIVSPPPTGSPPWAYEGKGKESWSSTILAATPGTWTLAVVNAPPSNAFGMVQLLPVKWTAAI